MQVNAQQYAEWTHKYPQQAAGDQGEEKDKSHHEWRAPGKLQEQTR